MGSSLRYPILVTSARSPILCDSPACLFGLGSGHARHSFAHVDPRPPRQFLREDVRLQQPYAVRHSIFPQLQKLLRYICERGFEHHMAANFSSVAWAAHEAASHYLGWDTYWHKP